MAEISEIHIEPIEETDLPQLTAVLKAHDLCHDDIDIKGNTFRKMTLAGEQVGFYGIEAHGDLGLLRSVVIVDAFRGTGLGNVLIEEALKTTRDMQLNALYLLTTTAADFFARYGFIITERGSAPEAITMSNEFRNFCPDTATCMVKHFHYE